jgi:hypothetical protein
MTTTYTFDQLKEDVRKEAEALRVHATKEELLKIVYAALDPQSRWGCIYGMATKDCHSERAIELIQKCCVRYFVNNSINKIKDEGFEGVVKRVNGTEVDDLKSDRTGMFPGHFSAIEAYILLPEANNESLIAFLRGETETLEL